MDLLLDIFVLGPLQTNCYLLRDNGVAAVVDPGLEPQPLIGFLRQEKIVPAMILLTHGHFDHIAGVAAVKALSPHCRLLCPQGDAPMIEQAERNGSAVFGFDVACPPADELVFPGEKIQTGQTQWQVLDSSGHTPGGVSYYCPQAKAVITGDALFRDSVGRTDIPGASYEQLIGNIRSNLLSLPDDTRVLPGHGPATTVGRERTSNPYLL